MLASAQWEGKSALPFWSRKRISRMTSKFSLLPAQPWDTPVGKAFIMAKGESKGTDAAKVEPPVETVDTESEAESAASNGTATAGFAEHFQACGLGEEFGWNLRFRISPVQNLKPL